MTEREREMIEREKRSGLRMMETEGGGESKKRGKKREENRRETKPCSQRDSNPGRSVPLPLELPPLPASVLTADF